MKVIVTGAAGFIGSSLSILLESLGFEVYGIDNINSYYDTKLKKTGWQELKILNFIKMIFQI